jgi:Cation efflux family
VVSGYALAHAPVVITGLSVLSAVVLAAGLAPFTKPRRTRHPPPRHGPTQPARQPPGARQLDAGFARDRMPLGILAAGPGPSVSASSGGSLIPGWSATRIWTLSLLLPALIAAVDGAAGRHIVLIGLLIAGPCCALLTARWLLTALTGILAAGLAVALGIPDGIWATSTHLTFIGSVVVVATSCTCAAALITKASPERRIFRLPVYAVPESWHRMHAYGATSAGQARQKLLGAALRLATISVAFGLLSGTVSIIAGLGDHSLGVLAVGLGVLADVSGSAILIWRFRAERRQPGHFDTVESRAATTIAIALALVAIVLIVQSAAALASRSHPGTSPVALAVAGVSFLMLAPLGYAKRRLGRRMGSRALQGDGTLSAIGAATSLLALIALALYDTLGWWWADRLAALVVAAIAITEARRTKPRRTAGNPARSDGPGR